MLTKADVGAASVSLAHVSATSLSPVGSRASFATDWPRDEWRDNRVSRGTIMVHHFDVTPCTRSYKCGVALTLHKLLISTGVELRFAEFISWFHATLSHFRLNTRSIWTSRRIARSARKCELCSRYFCIHYWVWTESNTITKYLFLFYRNSK